MLLRFGCSNHLSIRSFQEMSFVASTQNDNAGLLIEIPTSSVGTKALPCAVIYGANASGKSNYLKAFLFMRQMVGQSHVELTPEEDIHNVTFLLNPAAEDEVSQFECDFIEEGVRYSYGFSILRHKILTEFLYAYPKGHKQIWFTRNENGIPKFVFGKNLRGHNSIIGELTRSNSLFLSAAAQQNHDQLGLVYSFFAKKIKQAVSHPSEESGIPRLLESDRKDWVLRFLKSADVGISGSDVVEDTAQRDLFLRFFKPPHKNEGLNLFLDQAMLAAKKIRLGHTGTDGKPVFLPWETESSGTQQMLSLLVPVLAALDNGGVAVIDEIDSSLHTLVAMRLIELFKSPLINVKGAQLLFTTHDTNLLCCGKLRRDEIWFSEKNHEGETRVYPLSDFKTRSTDNLERGYLQGRFGALPFMGTVEDLVG